MTHTATIRRAALALSLLLAPFAKRQANAQAIPTATAPGLLIAVGGGGASMFQSGYGRNNIFGLNSYADLNLGGIGIEAEARFLRYHTSEDVTENNYLIGPRVTLMHTRALRPYVKFMVGQGHIVFPFRYAQGNYFAYAPGAGVEYSIHERYIVRVIDFEYQTWPQFTYGNLNPYGISAGISLRLNSIPRYPDGRRYIR
jgi:hypothetical protein